MTTYYYSGELYHHGVKGMKWGVRKQKPPSLNTTKRTDSNTENEKRKKMTLTKKQLEIGAAAAATAMIVLGSLYVKKKTGISFGSDTICIGKIVDISKLSDNDIVISANTKMQRISSKKVEDYASEGKRIYASYLKKDNRLYAEVMPGYIEKWRKQGVIEDGKGVYKHILTPAKEIKAPSKKKMAEIYMEATGNSSVDEGKYKSFMTKLTDFSNNEVNSFVEKVKERGYNAILDENDAGVFSKSPLIILDPSDNISSSKSHKITHIERFVNVLLM